MNDYIFNNFAQFYFFLRKNPYIFIKNKNVQNFRIIMNGINSSCECNINELKKIANKLYENINISEDEEKIIKETLNINKIIFKNNNNIIKVI